MKTNRRAQGFSLLEVLIAGGILVLVMGAIYTSLYSGSKEYEVNNRRAWVVHQARMALDEMSEDIRQATRLSVTPISSITTAPLETPPQNNVSFTRVLPSVGGVKQETAFPITYMWVTSGAGTVTAPIAPVGPFNLSGSLWVDANNNKLVDEGMLVKVDTNPNAQGLKYSTRILCSYLKPNPDGFQVTQSVVTVKGEKMLQVHLTLNLIFTDSLNKLQEQSLESKVFVRNLQ